MDPLSLTANIIAVVGAARSIAQLLERLRNFRRTPEKLLFLINEVSDFRTVLVIFQETSQQLQAHNRDPTHQHFEELIKRAETALNSINEVLATVLGSTATQSPGDRKFSWKVWFKIQGRVDRLFMALRDLRCDISSACTLLTASQIPFLRTETRIASLTSESETNLAQRTLLSMFTGNPNTPGSVIHTQASLKQACNPPCICRCHHSIKIKSPACLQNFLGLIFIGYSGLPLLPGGSCDQKACKKQSFSVLKLNYYFPSWFIHRMIVLKNQSNPLDGSVLSVRTPRIVKNGSEIFDACRFGKVNEIRRLFTEGLASPLDVDEFGQTTLSAALVKQDATVCKLLLECYADPTQEDSFSNSALRSVWGRLLTNLSDRDSQGFRTVFAPYLDVFDLQQMEFTAIHKTVLGLTFLGLHEQLQVSTTDIDSRCSAGKTPLMWAVSRSDVTSVRTLIGFGADLEVLDNVGMTCIHYACKLPPQDGSILLSAILKKPTTAKTQAQQHRLVNERRGSRLASSSLATAALNSNIECVRLLLDRGANNNIGNQYAIKYAVEQNFHELLILLLSYGFRRWDCTSSKRKGILHMAATIGDLRTIQIPASARLIGVQTNMKDIYGNTPLQLFLHVRQNYRLEDNTERDACFTAFLKLLDSVVPDSGEEASPGNETNQLHLDELNSHSESNGDEFFDALSDVISLEES